MLVLSIGLPLLVGFGAVHYPGATRSVLQLAHHALHVAR
jgi:hypothetical protein